MNIAEKIIIRAKTDNVWHTLRSFDRVEQYLSIVQKSEINGNGVGATRTCAIMTPNGSTTKAVEQLQYVNDDEKTIKFAILEAPFQVSNCLVTIKVSSKDANTELDFSTYMIPEEISEREATKIFSDIYQMMALGLEKLHPS